MQNYPKQEVVAMLLAGGQGSRLGVLTQNIAKPAVPFGGKYRIIDFTLSNCVNSGIEEVGVLTQYQPLVLNEYIGTGQPWDLDGIFEGVHCLSPYQQINGAAWYSGTANAIYQNINYIERYRPEYVIILSGDHIYKMDYSKMITYHKKNNADCTVASVDVSLREASRFGILNIREDGSIYEFDEKPANPKGTNASMGIYVFNWGKLRKYLVEDAEREYSSHDFGRDILPNMLNAGERMFAYRFDGYWKDVGTINSLWEANMDLLDSNVPIDLTTPKDKIYSRNPVMPPQYVAETAKVRNALIADGCNIYGEVDFSVLFAGVTVGEGAVVNDSIIMPGAVIGKNAVVQYAIVGENAYICDGAIVGGRPEEIEDTGSWGISVVGENLKVGKNARVAAKEMIYYDVEGK